MNITQNSDKGFTLIEIMVALAVLSIALVAVYKSMAGYISNTSYLEERALAQWVALNQLEEIKISDPWPSLGKSDGEVENFAGRNWFWKIEVLKTEDENMRGVEIKIYRDEDSESSLTTMLTYLGKPA